MLDVRQIRDATIFRVHDEIDLETVEGFNSSVALAHATSSKFLVIDLASCPYWDCSAMNVLIEVEKVRGDGLKVVVGPSETRRAVAKLLASTTRLTFYDSQFDALTPHYDRE